MYAVKTKGRTDNNWTIIGNKQEVVGHFCAPVSISNERDALAKWVAIQEELAQSDADATPVESDSVRIERLEEQVATLLAERTAP